MAGLGTEVSVSAEAAWAVSERTGKAGHSDLLMRMLGENAGASVQKTTGGMEFKRVGAASWASLTVFLTLVVRLGAVGPRMYILDKNMIQRNEEFAAIKTLFWIYY